VGLFYRADARSAGERARGFQVVRVSGRSNALDMGGPGCKGAALNDAKGLRPLGPWLRLDLQPLWERCFELILYFHPKYLILMNKIHKMFIIKY